MQGIKNLTHGPINRQLFNLAMPIMATSFIQMAYSLTDMAWVGRLGSEAVAAIGSDRNMNGNAVEIIRRYSMALAVMCSSSS